MSQLRLLFRLYFRPLDTFSRILDEGRLPFAVIAAVAVTLLLQLPREAEFHRQEMDAALRRAMQTVDRVVAKEASRGRMVTGEQVQRDLKDEGFFDGLAEPASPPTFQRAIDRFTGVNPTQYFSPLIAIALCFVPAAIALLTYWGNLGGFSTVLFRDYVALLVCVLLAWTAPYLLLAAANATLRSTSHTPQTDHVVWWTAHASFLALTALALRMLFGSSSLRVAGSLGGGWACAIGGIWLYGTFGNVTGYLASPFVLYYVYLGIGPQVAGIGNGLRSRQRLKHALELATLNPRDADAHYQLGIIYAQRRRHDAAIACFQQAIQIAPGEADAYFDLGKIARAQRRHQDALEQYRAAAAIDDRHSSSEVWREIGETAALIGDYETARQALAVYRERRPYDPEGACWHGRVLAALGDLEGARAAFDQAIEAVHTMPAARKRHVQSWESEARRERKKLAATGA
ncbi:MAG TPA: tetratricopeptide repeat protein [Candidatus Solibacter sp.]